MMHHTSTAAERGFTLVELVVAIMITGIIAGFVAMMTTAPVNAYLEQSGRSELNDTADLVAHMLEEDLAKAIPNSVSWRNSGVRSIIEFVKYEEVVFYRTDGEILPGDPIRDLTFTMADTQFSTYGQLYDGATGLQSGRLVLGNLGRSANVPLNRNIYRLPLPAAGVIFPSDRSMTIADTGGGGRRVQPTPGFQFVDPNTAVPANVPYYKPSPEKRAVRNRMFRVHEAVTYICNSSTRTLRRYSGYSTRAAIPTTETAAQLIAPGVTNTLVADNVSACQVRCWASDTNVCQDTLAVQIEFNRASVNGGNDRLRLHKQYRMDNDL